MSLLLLESAFVADPVNTRFRLFKGGSGSESARDGGSRSAVEVGNEAAMTVSVSVEGMTPWTPERGASSAGIARDVCWL